MKIAHVVPVFSKSNEEYIYLLIKQLLINKEDVSIITGKVVNGNVRKVPKIQVVSSRESGKLSNIALRLLTLITRKYYEFNPLSLQSQLQRISPDLIHAHFGLSACSLFDSKVPTLISMHGHDGNVAINNPKVWRMYKKLLANELVHFSFPSEYFKNAFVKKTKLSSQRAHVLRNPVNLSLFSPSKDGKASQGVIRLSCVGRFISCKNQEALVYLMARLSKRLIDVHLDLVGFGPDEQKLKALVEDLGLCNSVSFHVNIPRKEISNILRSTSIYVQPSIADAVSGSEETFNVAVMEALASGCISIIADKGAMKEVYGGLEGVGVELFDANQLNSLEDKVLQVIGGYEFDQGIVDTFIESFQPELVAKELDSIYLKLVQPIGEHHAV